MRLARRKHIHKAFATGRLALGSKDPEVLRKALENLMYQVTRWVRDDEFTTDGNNGGSYVTIRQTGTEGMVQLEVGETCVVTVDQRISVAALAAILTQAKDDGFQNVVDRYLQRGGGQPVISVSADPATSYNRRRRS